MACGANRKRDDHSSCTPVARRIKLTYPNGRSGQIWDFSRAVPIRSCSRWGLPCRFRRRKRGALLPHRFTLAAAKRNAPRRSVLCGTIPGVLSPPDVIRHRLSVEPGLSSPAAFRHWHGAAVRPTDADRNGRTRTLRQELSRDSLKETVRCLISGDGRRGRRRRSRFD